MMILRSSPASPFGRKVKIAASLLGLSDRIEIVVADTADAGDSLRTQNPLGKIPVLVLDDGTNLFDSRVIVEFLDSLAGGDKLIPKDPKTRFPLLAQVALAEGLMEACLLLIYEIRFREPAKHEANWVTHQTGKVLRALDEFAKNPPSGATRDAAHIGLACALGYLDLRFEGKWRQSHAALVPWLEAFARDVPAFEATRVKPA